VLPVSLEIKLPAQTREVDQHREFELNVLDGQCLDRRVTDEAILKAEYPLGIATGTPREQRRELVQPGRLGRTRCHP